MKRTPQTLEQIAAQYGDWSQSPIEGAVDLIRSKQARLLADIERFGAGIYVPVLDYLKAQAEGDPTDPEVAKYFLVRKNWGWADFYSEIQHLEKVPRPVGRPTKAAPDKRSRRLVFLATEAEEAAILARVPPGRDFSDWAREQLLAGRPRTRPADAAPGQKEEHTL